MTTTIWDNGTDTQEKLLTDAKSDAKQHIQDAIADGRGYTGDALVDGILAYAWHHSGDPHEPLTPTQYRQGIDDVTLDCGRIGELVGDLNFAYLDDAQLNLDAIKLDRPTLVIGSAGLWDGRQNIANVVEFNTVGDILRREIWAGMDETEWKIDDDGDLAYTGRHHDGVNTCVYRRIPEGVRLTTGLAPATMRDLTQAIGPRILETYGLEKTK